MHVAIVTAGGAGMFCGSCMHDNTWARALRDAGVEVTLIPTYTPIRVDEENLSSQRVFFGGINVYLEHRWDFWRRLPRWMTRWVDHPKLISLATSFSVSNDASNLGELTLAMLDGESGPQQTDVEELAAFIGNDLKPDVVCFSNALLCGVLRRLKQQYSGPVFCTLQGDDIFLDSLPDKYRVETIRRMSERSAEFDGFLVHSHFYRDHMSKLLGLPAERFHRIPLGIDFADFDGQPKAVAGEPFRIGYFARICPEKGLHVLIDAVRTLRQRGRSVRLVAGGYLGSRDQAWFDCLRKDAADLGTAFEYAGSPPDHAGKVAFLKTLDVLCVPTVYREPKGIFVLESLASGVPVVQPAHGSFPEMLDQTGGGLLYQPDDPAALMSSLERLIDEPALRLRLATEGSSRVREAYSMEAMVRQTQSIFGAQLQSLQAIPSKQE